MKTSIIKCLVLSSGFALAVAQSEEPKDGLRLRGSQQATLHESSKVDGYNDDYLDDDWQDAAASNAMNFVKSDDDDDDFLNTCVRYGFECQQHSDCCFGSCEYFSRLGKSLCYKCVSCSSDSESVSDLEVNLATERNEPVALHETLEEGLEHHDYGRGYYFDDDDDCYEKYGNDPYLCNQDDWPNAMASNAVHLAIEEQVSKKEEPKERSGPVALHGTSMEGFGHDIGRGYYYGNYDGNYDDDDDYYYDTVDVNLAKEGEKQCLVENALCIRSSDCCSGRCVFRSKTRYVCSSHGESAEVLKTD